MHIFLLTSAFFTIIKPDFCALWKIVVNSSIQTFAQLNMFIFGTLVATRTKNLPVNSSLSGTVRSCCGPAGYWAVTELWLWSSAHLSHLVIKSPSTLWLQCEVVSWLWIMCNKGRTWLAATAVVTYVFLKTPFSGSFLCVMAGMKMALVGSCIWILGPQSVELLGKD